MLKRYLHPTDLSRVTEIEFSLKIKVRRRYMAIYANLHC